MSVSVVGGCVSGVDDCTSVGVWISVDGVTSVCVCVGGVCVCVCVCVGISGNSLFWVGVVGFGVVGFGGVHVSVCEGVFVSVGAVGICVRGVGVCGCVCGCAFM